MSGTVLVYGPYPPAPGPGAATTLAAVRALLADGARVVVVSPAPSGAHHHADAMGLRGTLAFGRHRARIRPDETVAYLDAGLLRARRGGRKELTARRLFGFALRGATVHLDDLSGRLDRPYVELTVGSAGRIVVTSAENRDALVAAGVDPGRVTVGPPAGAGGEAPPLPRLGRADWDLGAAPNRATLEAEIRRRAAAERAAAASVATVMSETDAVAAAGPLSRISPYYAAAPVGSPRLVTRVVKQVVWRLTRFELEPVVDQVNLLHRATLEELRPQERAGPPPREGPAGPAADTSS